MGFKSNNVVQRLFNEIPKNHVAYSIGFIEMLDKIISMPTY